MPLDNILSLSSGNDHRSVLATLLLIFAVVCQPYFVTKDSSSAVEVEDVTVIQDMTPMDVHVLGDTAVAAFQHQQISQIVEQERMVPLPIQQIYRDYFSSTYNTFNVTGVSTMSFWERETLNGGVLDDTLSSFGPCYLPNVNTSDGAWANSGNERMFLDILSNDTDVNPKYGYLQNQCKPGFLIIGAGKAGTSSLYKYLVGHDRVLPAKIKQVQFFKYHHELGMRWYLSHFPTAKAFLSSGALMTGEAAPGYLPYPEVAARTQIMMPGSKLLLLVREPIDRAWSSYNYNYYLPGLKKLNDLYENESYEYLASKYLYTFEDMIRAEMSMLKECMEPGGAAEIEGLKQSYWANSMMVSRRQRGLSPMIDIINGCYGTEEKRNQQWAPLRAQNPEGILDLPNTHRWEGMLGRGLYAVQAEWWYTAYPNNDIHMICSNEMKVKTASVLNSVTEFLGLPEFVYSDIVSQGMYNVRGHEGYDKLTSWNNEKEEKSDDSIPISDVFREELNAFVQIHNERLFSLVGKRCSW